MLRGLHPLELPLKAHGGFPFWKTEVCVCTPEMAETVEILSTATGGAGSAGLAWGPEPNGLTDVHSVPETSRQGSRDPCSQ